MADPGFAILRITRVVVYDDHPDGKRATASAVTGALELPYGDRAPAAQPVVRTYTVRIAVPRGEARTWELAPGDDYRLLITASGATIGPDAVDLRYKIRSNYQFALPDKAPIGPNGFGFERLERAKGTAWLVANDETKAALVAELDQTTLEAVTSTPPPGVELGVADTVEHQAAREAAWAAVRVRSLR